MHAASAILALLAFTAAPDGPPPRDTAAGNADLRAVFTAPIAIERAAPVAATPLEVRMGKLFLDAVANGQTREFIFDTGSPTILTRAFADELGLEVVGQNSGVDANGNVVTMDVAVLDSLSIGSVTFRNVPVLIFDFGALDLAPCLLDGGIIGSELFPGSAWRIDTQNRRLTIAGNLAALGGAAPAVRARLYDFGYPHAPIVDYALAEVSDKALFDTGSAEQVTLFRRVAESPSVRASIAPASLSVGRGYEGESAGGRGQIAELVRFTLRGFRIGQQPLGTVRATRRGVPPTLVGAGVLASHIVTLDYPGEQLLLENRSEPNAPRPEAGYAIRFVGEQASVVQLFDGSAAAEAGLRVGDGVVAVQGRSLVVTRSNPKCEAARWLAESFDPTAAADIVVQRGSAPLTIRVPAARAGAAAASG